jgi:hypothetical protein
MFAAYAAWFAREIELQALATLAALALLRCAWQQGQLTLNRSLAVLHIPGHVPMKTRARASCRLDVEIAAHDLLTGLIACVAAAPPESADDTAITVAGAELGSQHQAGWRAPPP